VSARFRDLPAHAVAVVGMAARFPGAPDVEAFWSNLCAGRESITFFTEEELRDAGVPASQLEDPSYVPARGLIDGADRFDASFFGLSPREAELMDPQHRLLLECAWHALENAGHAPGSFPGPFGVFAGCGSNTYLLTAVRGGGGVLEPAGLYQAMLGSDGDFLATRISYKLGLRGPSLTVQTACSTSLVATHLAVQSLLNGECDMALAGGVRVSVPQRAGYLYQREGIFSPDGHCRPFDADAQGCLDGDGVGVVVLRRLDDALADGDHVHAVILGSAVNNDGADKVGYTAPGVQGQAEVIATAQALAGLDPSAITYVEAHGTATPLGDPIEIAALTRAFRGAPRGSCAIGSVKSNVGHLDAAAGVASLIKCVLSLEHGQLPPSLHFHRPNPHLRLDETPFRVNDRLTEWSPQAGPRRAGVSAFGIGGTNAHLILEEPPRRERSATSSRPHHLLVLSAATESALEESTRRLAAHLASDDAPDLADAAFTLQAGRRPMAHRRIAVCRSTADAADVLGSLDPRWVLSRVSTGSARPVAFLFPGQGAQHPGMAEALYRSEPGFRDRLDRCAEILAPELGCDLRSILFPGEAEGAEDRLRRTELAQPALFAVEHSLAGLWMDWGVVPEALAGHSLGELVAACVAGVIDHEDALRLVAARGRLMQQATPGSMVSVPLPAAEVREMLGAAGTEGGPLELAAINAPSLSVVSGPDALIEELVEELGRRGVEARRLHTSHGFHSRTMDRAAAALAREVRSVTLRPPRIPFLSNVTGTWIRTEEATDPEYWGRQLRATVRFSSGAEELLADPDRVLLEVGPGRSLTTLVLQHRDGASGRVVVPSLPGASSTDPATATLTRTLGRLWLAGVEIDWTAYHDGVARRRVALPGYPFEGRRFWLAGGAPLAAGSGDRVSAAALDAVRLAPDDRLYALAWRPAPAGLPTAPEDLAERWLVLTGGGDAAARVADALEARGGKAIRVRIGAALAGDPDGGFELPPDDPEAFERLVEHLADGEGLPQRIVHGWSLGGPDDPDSVRRRGFGSLEALLRALARAGTRRAPAAGFSEQASGGEPPQGAFGPIQVTALSDGMHRLAEEPSSPIKALLLGPVLVAPQEIPGLVCRSVDLPSTPNSRPAERALEERLLGEIARPDGERLVLYRGGRRWLPHVERMPPRGAAEAPDRTPLRSGGVYLVTGGLGGIGLAVAEHLAREAGARLALVSRRTLPPRERWQEVATGAADSEEAEVVRRLLAIERLGGQVLPVAADVADRQAMAVALERIREELGPIHGVVHAAGNPGSGPIVTRTGQAADAVLRPKVDGCLVLEELVDFSGLDFVVLFSSLNGLIGGPGQADYAAANAFLDAFAEARSADGLPVVAVAWDRWDGVGMAATRDSGGGEPADLAAFDHPFLERRGRRPDGTVVFLGRLAPDRAWVLDEHRLGGHPVVPGTVYLDMAAAAARAEADAPGVVELRDVLFLAPLRVEDGDARKVRLTLEPAQEGWRFTVDSRAGREGAAWRIHATGLASGRVAAAAHRPSQASPEELIERCGPGARREEMGEEYHHELGLMGLGARWGSLRTVWAGVAGTLALAELPAAFSDDLADHVLHPALLDVVTSFAERAADADGGYYLPLSYGRLRIHGPLPRRVYALARRAERTGAGRETLAFDLQLYDGAGRERVAIERFTLKRVGDVALTIRDAGAAERPAASDGPAGMTEAEGIEAFHRVLGDRRASRWAVSVVDLEAVMRHARAWAAGNRPEAAGASGGERHARPELGSPFVAPEGEVEVALADLWGEILGVEPIGTYDDFFELGGHSLSGTQLISRIRDRFGADLSIERLFEAPTVSALARLIEEGRGRPGAGSDAIPPVADGETGTELPLSYPQERLWFLDQFDPGNPFYNISQAVQLAGRLDVRALAECLRTVFARHAILRTAFGSRRGTPFQVVLDRVEPHLPVIDLGALPEGERERVAYRLATDLTGTSFDLEAPPLAAFRLVRTGPERHVLAVTLHHIVSDGWSIVVLITEVAGIYRALVEGDRPTLDDLPIQYGDFAIWQRRGLDEPDAESEDLEYWRRQLAGPLPVLDLPAGRPRPERSGFRGASETVRLPKDLTSGLKELCTARGATPFMGLLSAFALVLAGNAGQEELVVGSPVAGRDRTELEGLIGMFLNTLVLRLGLAAGQSFEDLLAHTRGVTLGAYAHQEVPIEKLMEALQPDRSTRRPALFQVLFNMQDFPNRTFELPGLTLTPLHLRDVPSKFDLTAYAAEVDGEILFELVYNTELFVRDDALRLLDELTAVVSGAIASPGESLERLAPTWAPGRKVGAAAEHGFRLAPVQRRLLRLFGSETAGRAQCAVTLEGPLAADGLAAALAAVVARHEILRTALRPLPGLRVPLQQVGPAPEADGVGLPAEEDLTGDGEAAGSERIASILAEERSAALDVTGAVPFRLRLLRTGPETRVLVVTLSVLHADSATLDNLVLEIARALEEEAGGAPAAEVPVQYAQFAAWQRRKQDEAPAGRAADLWRRHGAVVDRATDRAAGPPAVERLAVDAGELLAGLASACEVPPRAVLLAAWSLLLGRWTGAAAAPVGIVDPARSSGSFRGLLGPTARVLPLRPALDPERPFADAAREARDLLEEVAAHADAFRWQGPAGEATAPAARWVCELTPPPPVVEAAGVRLAVLRRAVDVEPFEAALRWAPGEDVEVELLFDSRRLSRARAEAMARGLTTLMDDARNRATTPVVRLEALHVEDGAALAETLRGERPEPFLPVHQVIARQAAEAPDAVALVSGGATVTYGELEVRAERLAHRLAAAGLGAEDRVGLLLERSPELAAAILGSWKAGAAFVALDPDLPDARLAAIVRAARPALVVSGAELVGRLGGVDIPVLAAAGDDAAAFSGPVPGPGTGPVATDPDQLAYVVFTSGSTGRPKGILTPHRGVSAYLTGLQHRQPLGPEDTVLQVAAPAFDASVRDLIGPLLAGARVAIAPPDVGRDPEVLLGAIDGLRVTALLSAVPTMLRGWLAGAAAGAPAADVAASSALRLLLVSGEVLRTGDCRAVRALFGQRVEIVNQYGPSETTFTSTYRSEPVAGGAAGTAAPDESPIPIGGPVAGCTVSLLDPFLRPVPPGVPGEIALSGAGVTRGYLDDPRRTAMVFVPDPGSRAGERTVRTGDLGRLRDDGAVEFLGRFDDQVKIRGQRIELGEVESHLAAHPGVREAAVVVRDGGAGGSVLVAYLVYGADGPVEPAALRAFLEGRLPAAMIPAAFAPIDALPRTASGKLRRDGLPAGGEVLAAPGGGRPPESPLEQAVAAIWQQLLGLDEIGADDSFFLLGGHSLLATQMTARVHEQLGVAVPLRRFWERPTVAGVAAEIEWMRAAEARGEGTAADAPPSAPSGTIRRRSRGGGGLAKLHARLREDETAVDEEVPE